MPGSKDLELPEELREPILQHLMVLRRGFEKRGWGGRAGFGERPAVIVIDLAKGWTDAKFAYGSNLESVVENTCKVLEVARQGRVPIFFTIMAYGPDDPNGLWELKFTGLHTALAYGSEATELDPRLGRRSTEKLLVKKYTSAFKGTDLQ